MRRKKRFTRVRVLYIVIMLSVWLLLRMGYIESREFSLLLCGAIGSLMSWTAIEEYRERREFDFTVLMSVISAMVSFGLAIYLLVQ